MTKRQDTFIAVLWLFGRFNSICVDLSFGFWFWFVSAKQFITSPSFSLSYDSYAIQFFSLDALPFMLYKIMRPYIEHSKDKFVLPILSCIKFVTCFVLYVVLPFWFLFLFLFFLLARTWFRNIHNLHLFGWSIYVIMLRGICSKPWRVVY